MFQCALALAVAAERQSQVAFDLKWFDHPGGLTARSYELGCFNIPATHLRLKRRRLRLRGPRLKVFHEKSFWFDPAALQVPDNTLFIGYWQSEKYFRRHENLIRDAFRFENVDRWAKVLGEECTGRQSVSVHVRRGDYAEDEAATKSHGLLGPEYYERALDVIMSKVTNPHLYVFSDDIMWCETSFRSPVPITFVARNQGHKDYQDMYLMSRCRHHILANSSFSWWGAWLNADPSKVVVAPSRWVRDSSDESGDRLPEVWMTV